MRLQSYASVVLAAVGLSLPSVLQANTVTLTLTPGAPGSSNVNGNAGTAAPGYGTGSWAAPGTSKSELYVAASSLFSGPVTIDDIASISYWTNKGGTAADVDWTFIMYTTPTGTNDSASWYHSRLNSEPYFSQTPSVAANTWHEWSTAAADAMKFYDAPRSGTFGTYTDPTLGDLKNGTVTWGNNVSNDYGSEVINLFSLQTGSAWANGFTGLVDGMKITLNNGDVGIVNLEATAAVVPLPAAAWMGMALMSSVGGVGFLRKRRKNISEVM